MAISLPVKYRPQTFNDVTEQGSIIKILDNQIKNNNICNAMLFAGQSGGGKTTIARAFANKIDSQIIEIDAASNNGVDNIRNLIEEAQGRSVSNKYKTVILDEAHMLSNSAWNALLKLIEEPPQYTVFIFCTTDPQKIPATIASRVQRYNFTKISNNGIYDRLVYVCKEENLIYEDDALDYISKIANGSMREALSLLGQVVDYSNNININSTKEALGDYSQSKFFNLANAILDGNEKGVIEQFDNFINMGNDLKLFVDQYLEFNLDIVKYCLFKNIENLNIPNIYVSELNNLIAFDKPENYYNYIIDKLLKLKNDLKMDSNIKTTILVTLLQVARCQ